MPRSADRDLRRLVARLAQVGSADRDLVLASLEPGQVEEIARLMAELEGVDVDRSPPGRLGERDWSRMGLSPMMVGRLNADGANIDGLYKEMTPAAWQLLLDSADRLLPPPNEPQPRLEATAPWWGRLGRWRARS